jgi:hypothetical protein
MLPPPGFGTSDVAWDPEPTDDPSHVAALWLQHRILVEMRGHDVGASARKLAAVTGRSKDVTSGWLRGDGIMGLRDALSCVRACGLSLGDFVGPSGSLLPRSYDPLMVDSNVRADGWPIFRVRGLNDHLLAGLDAAVAMWASEAEAARESALGAGVLAHVAVVAADSSWCPAATAEPPSQQGAPPLEASVSYAARDFQRLELCFLPDVHLSSAPVASQAVLSAVLSAPSAKEQRLMLLVGSLALAQMERHAGDLSLGARLSFRGHDLDPNGAVDDCAYLVDGVVSRGNRAGFLLRPD